MTSTSTNSPPAAEFHVFVSTGGDKAVDLLVTASGLSRGQVKSAMSKGAAWLSRGRKVSRVRRGNRGLRPGDELHLYYNESVLNVAPPMPELVEDLGDYSVWNKPHGLRSQGSKWGDHCALVRIAEQTLQRTGYTVHRLDRAASGLILVAHNRKTAARLSAMFRERQIEKRYLAVVNGRFPAMPATRRVETHLDGKHAVSEFSLSTYDADTDTSEISVRIETGRKHQVRRHLAELGFPILGDRLYGGGDSTDLQLKAVMLAFDCPCRGDYSSFELPR